MNIIKDPIDFIGINYYTTVMLEAGGQDFPFVKAIDRNLPKTDMGWEIEPKGLTDAINLVSHYAPELPLYITENGMASANTITDEDRIEYYRDHLNEVAKATRNLPIKGYFAWSLLDNFEWVYGYQKKFGLVYVDFSTQERIPKQSYYAFQKAFQTKK